MRLSTRTGGKTDVRPFTIWQGKDKWKCGFPCTFSWYVSSTKSRYVLRAHILFLREINIGVENQNTKSTFREASVGKFVGIYGKAMSSYSSNSYPTIWAAECYKTWLIEKIFWDFCTKTQSQIIIPTKAYRLNSRNYRAQFIKHNK